MIIDNFLFTNPETIMIIKSTAQVGVYKEEARFILETDNMVFLSEFLG